MKKNNYLNKIRKIAVPTLQAAFSAHLKIDEICFHLSAVRREDSLPWGALNGTVLFGDSPLCGEEIEMLSLYLNGFFTSDEAIKLADYFYDNHKLELEIKMLQFPLPLPYSITYLDFENEFDNPYHVMVGNWNIRPSATLLSFLYDETEGSPIWEESDFDSFFGWKERHGNGIHSFQIPEGKILRDISISGYSEPKGVCFLDEAKGVHNQVKRERIK